MEIVFRKEQKEFEYEFEFVWIGSQSICCVNNFLSSSVNKPK